jgi:hypothetical protein
MTELTALERCIGRWILAVAPDYEKEYESHGSDEILDSAPPLSEFSIQGVELHEPDGDAPFVLVQAEATGAATKRVSRGSRHHPPEYERTEVPVFADVSFHFDGLGYTKIDIRAEGDPYAPPDPEGQWRDV